MGWMAVQHAKSYRIIKVKLRKDPKMFLQDCVSFSNILVFYCALTSKKLSNA